MFILYQAKNRKLQLEGSTGNLSNTKFILRTHVKQRMKNVDNINNHFLIICCLLLGYCKSNNSRVNEIHTEKYDFNKEIFNNIDTACKFLKQVKHLELGFIKGGFPLRLLDFENLESLVILYSELDSIPNEINKLKN
ncbi:MAG: hypothetical protein IPJ43_17405 [Saprospiraceae bacterium]|nr:hypothetical protein [Saprospiraceae bacterium]